MSQMENDALTHEFLVNLGEFKATNVPTACLATSTLGSGVAVAVHDSEIHISGLLHFVLPQWEINKTIALENPSIFANSGIPQLYRHCYKLGAVKEHMRCFLIGGADVLDTEGAFGLGTANLEAAITILKANGVEPDEQWVGGNESRIVKLYNADGRLVVQTTREYEFQL